MSKGLIQSRKFQFFNIEEGLDKITGSKKAQNDDNPEQYIKTATLISQIDGEEKESIISKIPIMASAVTVIGLATYVTPLKELIFINGVEIQ